MQKRFPLILILLIMFSCSSAGENILNIFSQYRRVEDSLSIRTAVFNDSIAWKGSQTAIIICDMWDQHWCSRATERVAELAPAIDTFARAARKKGILIVHAPSSNVDYYEEHAARKNALSAPEATNIPEKMGDWQHGLDGENKDLWPIDQSDGGCDSDPPDPQGHPWTKQIDAIEIMDDDIISDDGVEIWNVFEQRGIQNVILVGVHTNMCVIGRPFGLRNMKRVGKNVLLCRDLTDTMYNPKMKPYVSHFKGTDLIVEYIERFVCPTMLSTSLTMSPRFRFKEDKSTD